MAIRGFLFDLDGTLDTLDELAPALVGGLDAHYGSGMGVS